MIKLAVIIFLSFTLSQSGFACSCTNRTKELIKEMYEHSDYVFTGTVVSGAYWENEILDFWNSRSMGHHVYMRVDSAIKGDIRINQIVYIYQASGGCIETFEYNSENLVFGRQIKKLAVVKEKEETEEAVNSNLVPPPAPGIYGLNENGTYKTNYDAKKLTFLKAKLDHYSVIDTNMCSTFPK